MSNFFWDDVQLLSAFTVVSDDSSPLESCLNRSFFPSALSNNNGSLDWISSHFSIISSSGVFPPDAEDCLGWMFRIVVTILSDSCSWKLMLVFFMHCKGFWLVIERQCIDLISVSLHISF